MIDWRPESAEAAAPVCFDEMLRSEAAMVGHASTAVFAQRLARLTWTAEMLFSGRRQQKSNLMDSERSRSVSGDLVWGLVVQSEGGSSQGLWKGMAVA